MSVALDYLERLLVSRLNAVEAQTKTFRAGFRLRDEVLQFPRLVLVVSGSMDYMLDDRQWTLLAGDQVLVPAFFQRTWTARGKTPLTLSWFQFSINPVIEDLPTLLRLRAADMKTEVAALQRIQSLFAAHAAEHCLEPEAEMKAVLGRFLAHAAPSETESMVSRSPHPSELAVAEAARWLARNFAQADAIEQAIQRSRLSLNHFRLVFKQRLGMNPHQYLAQLRMRAARYCLHETDQSVKEVACRVGYSDAFYFSRVYSRFWGHAPTKDREYQ